MKNKIYENEDENNKDEEEEEEEERANNMVPLRWLYKKAKERRGVLCFRFPLKSPSTCSLSVASR